MATKATPPLRGALIGCGFVARFHLEGWSRVSEARIVAVCDVDPARLEQAARQVPEARAFRSAAEMLASVPVDFVEICTGPEAHPGLTALAARQGAHILCQKPAALTRGELLAMIADSDAAGVRLMIHENWRFRPWYRTLKRLLDDGSLGRPIRLRLAHRDTRALRPEGFADQPFLGSRDPLILLEMGPHLVDIARFLLGEVVEVAAVLGRFGGHPGEDLATLSLRFASGALALLDMTWCAPAEIARPEWALNETVLEGTEATLRLRADGSLLRVALDGRETPQDVPLPAPPLVYVDAFRASQAHFVAGLISGTPHETSGRDTLRTMDVLWSAYRSAAERRSIPIDPANPSEGS